MRWGQLMYVNLMYSERHFHDHYEYVSYDDTNDFPSMRHFWKTAVKTLGNFLVSFVIYWVFFCDYTLRMFMIDKCFCWLWLTRIHLNVADIVRRNFGISGCRVVCVKIMNRTLGNK